jgi:hypothetical protein
VRRVMVDGRIRSGTSIIKKWAAGGDQGSD